VEALVRWEHPRYGRLLPQHFIPLAEETGLIVQLGAWVLSEACRQLHTWRREYPQVPLAISVNISGRQLQGTGLADALRQALARAIIGLGDTLRLHTIAEGIEMAQQRSALIELGCSLGQGHHFWPALPAAAIGELLANDRSPRLRLVEDSA